MTQNSNTARVVGFVEISKAQQKEAAQKTGGKSKQKPRNLGSVLGAANSPDSPRPIVLLTSGKERAIEKIVVKENMGMVDVFFVPDCADGMVASDDGTLKPATHKSLRLPLNQPIVGWSQLPATK